MLFGSKISVQPAAKSAGTKQCCYVQHKSQDSCKTFCWDVEKLALTANDSLLCVRTHHKDPQLVPHINVMSTTRMRHLLRIPVAACVLQHVVACSFYNACKHNVRSTAQPHNPGQPQFWQQALTACAGWCLPLWPQRSQHVLQTWRCPCWGRSEPW